MTILTHVVLGGVAGSFSKNLILSALLGFLSHFFFDLVPHNDYIYFFAGKNSNPYTSQLSKLILALTVVGLIFLLWIKKSPWDGIFLGATSAIIPDALTGLSSTLKLKSSFLDRFHRLMHQRPTLAEFLYDRFSKLEKIEKNRELTTNYQLLKNSPWARVGWVIELLVEIGLLVFSLRFIL